MLKITIIMPVFNAENTILSAINSFNGLCRNNFLQAKLIVVDDNSTDNTLKILKSIKNKNIEIIENFQNIGPGASRNKALNLINEGYVGFLDADDNLISENYLRSLIDGYEIGSDLITFNAYINKNGVISERYDFKRINSSKSDLHKQCLRGDIDGSVIFSIYSVNFIRKYDIKFALQYYEDIIFSYKALMHCKNLFKSKLHSYEKKDTTGSILNTISPRHINGMIEACVEYKEFLIAHKKFSFKRDEVDYIYGLNGYIFHLISCICLSDQPISIKISYLISLYKKTVNLVSSINNYSQFISTTKDKVVYEFFKSMQTDDNALKFLSNFEGQVI